MAMVLDSGINIQGCIQKYMLKRTFIKNENDTEFT
jgi:hypothetical protein